LVGLINGFFAFGLKKYEAFVWGTRKVAIEKRKWYWHGGSIAHHLKLL